MRNSPKRGQYPDDSLQDLQLDFFCQGGVEVGAFEEVAAVHGEDHLAILLREDPVLACAEGVERQAAGHLGA